MAVVAGNGCNSADVRHECNTQDLDPRSAGSLGERANRAHWAYNHVLVRPRSWNSIPVRGGNGGGAQPTFWLPIAVPIDLPRSLSAHPVFFRC